jgi:hypothetical protein
MKTVWNWVQAVFTAIGGFLGWFLGGLDGVPGVDIKKETSHTNQ